MTINQRTFEWFDADWQGDEDPTIAPFYFLKKLFENNKNTYKLTHDVITKTLSLMIDDEVFIDNILEKREGDTSIFVLSSTYFLLYNHKNDADNIFFITNQQTLYFKQEHKITRFKKGQPWVEPVVNEADKLDQFAISNEELLQKTKTTIVRNFFAPKPFPEKFEKMTIQQFNPQYNQNDNQNAGYFDVRKMILTTFGELWKVIVEIFTQNKSEFDEKKVDELWNNFRTSNLWDNQAVKYLDDPDVEEYDLVVQKSITKFLSNPLFNQTKNDTEINVSNQTKASSFLLKPGVLGLTITKNSLTYCDSSVGRPKITTTSKIVVSDEEFNRYLIKLFARKQVDIKMKLQDIELQDIKEALVLREFVEEESKIYHATIIEIIK